MCHVLPALGKKKCLKLQYFNDTAQHLTNVTTIYLWLGPFFLNTSFTLIFSTESTTVHNPSSSLLLTYISSPSPQLPFFLVKWISIPKTRMTFWRSWFSIFHTAKDLAISVNFLITWYIGSRRYNPNNNSHTKPYHKLWTNNSPGKNNYTVNHPQTFFS
jgi:hypothetical protein